MFARVCAGACLCIRGAVGTAAFVQRVSLYNKCGAIQLDSPLHAAYTRGPACLRAHIQRVGQEWRVGGVGSLLQFRMKIM